MAYPKVVDYSSSDNKSEEDSSPWATVPVKAIGFAVAVAATVFFALEGLAGVTVFSFVMSLALGVSLLERVLESVSANNAASPSPEAGM